MTTSARISRGRGDSAPAASLLPALAAIRAASPAPHPSRNLRRRMTPILLANVAGLLRLSTPHNYSRASHARVAELADAQVLGTCAERREGSSPSSRSCAAP